MKTHASFNECYRDLLSTVYRTPDHESAPRGQKVRESLCISFRITDPRDRLLSLPSSDRSLAYAVAESLWYLGGNDSTAWIAYYAPFWNKITDDGTTANSAYGARIFRELHTRVHIPQVWEAHPNRRTQSQWEYVKTELRRDPDSRRAVIQIRSAADSWLAQKDVPCTLALQFFLRDGALHMVANMRSSDLVLGIPYDVFAFTLFQELMANELGARLGSYTHVSNSLHVYERDFAQADMILAAADAGTKGSFVGPMPAIPRVAPPVMKMMALEAKLRLIDNVHELSDALYDAADDLLPAHAYWMDWIKVLASHRAARLKLPAVQRSFLRSTTWKGYQEFAR